MSVCEWMFLCEMSIIGQGVEALIGGLGGDETPAIGVPDREGDAEHVLPKAAARDGGSVETAGPPVEIRTAGP